MNESVAKQETHGCLWRHDQEMGSRRACHVAILALTGLGWDYPALNRFLVCEMGGHNTQFAGQEEGTRM